MSKNNEVYSLFCFVGLDVIVNNIYIGIADYITHRIEAYDRDIIANNIDGAKTIAHKVVNELANHYPVDRPKLNAYVNKSIRARMDMLSLSGFTKRLTSSSTYDELLGIDTIVYDIDQSYFEYYKKAYAIMSMDVGIQNLIINAISSR